METNYIKLRQERDFGEVFNATFMFLKQEYKGLGKVLLYYTLPLVLLTALASALYQSKVGKVAFDPAQMGDPVTFLHNFLQYYLLLMFMYLLSHTMLLSTLYGYMALYQEKGREGFTLDDVLKRILKLFVPVFFGGILCGIILFLGLMLCILPGIYLGVSLSLIFISLAVEQKGFGSAFGRTFELTHTGWWWTLLLIIVVYLIVMVISMILSVPAMVAGFSTALHQVSQGGGTPQLFSPFFIAYTAIISVISTFLYLIPQTALAFQYFSLVEKKEKPTLLNKIDEIGNT
jgi:hypothetical protein